MDEANATDERESLAALFVNPDDASTLAEAARIVLLLRRQVEAAETEWKNAKEVLTRAEESFLTLCREQGASAVKVALDGKSFTVGSTTSDHYSVPAGSLEDGGFFRWLLTMGGHDLVRRTVHHMSLSAFCRELAEAGKSLHPLVQKVEKKVVRVTAAR